MKGSNAHLGLAPAAVQRFRHALLSWAKRSHGDVILPSDSRFERARRLYNRLHDLRPAAIVRCLDAVALAAILRIAKDSALPVAVRGGGHHIAGFGSCDAGLLIDFSPFRRISVDPVRRTCDVEPGARLGDVDRALCLRGYVVPSGTVSRTGIAGLTLGGGIGWLVGVYGLTCDHLIGATAVLANGHIVSAEDSEHHDLLWALRGGGGNFGVVTRFRYRLRFLPHVTTGTVIVTAQDAAQALRRLLSFLEGCPSELTIAPVLRRDENGMVTLVVEFCLSGRNQSALRALRRSLNVGEWLITKGDDFVRWQRTGDSLFEPPMRGYWKARYGKQPAAVDGDVLIDLLRRAPVKRCTILIEHLHGAIAEGNFDTSAFPLRAARIGILVSARWRSAVHDDVAKEWVRSAILKLDCKEFDRTYSNYSSADDAAVWESFPHSVAERLARVKATYDGDNVFSRNHNIKPARF